MYQPQRILIKDVNEFLTCKLCSGYFIDATTIIECLHSFCRSCIVTYLESNKYCPVCDVQVHDSKPFLKIKPDKILQDVVYKLVPKLFRNESERRRQFYAEHPEAKPTGFEKQAESTYEYILSTEDSICVSLIYKGRNGSPRFLRCPAGVSILHLKKLIRAKYDLHEGHKVDIFYNQDCLNSYLTLMDVAYISSWIRKDPLDLTYCIYEKVVDSNDKVVSDLVSESLPNNNNDWKEVQLRISESGEMSITGIENCLDLIEKDLIKVDEAVDIDKTIIVAPVVDEKVESVVVEDKETVVPDKSAEDEDKKKEDPGSLIAVEVVNGQSETEGKELELKTPVETLVKDKAEACDLKDTNANITSTINNCKRKLDEDVKSVDSEPSCKVLKPVDVSVRETKTPVTIISNCKITPSNNSGIKQLETNYRQTVENINLTSGENLSTSSSSIQGGKKTTVTHKSSLPSITTGINPNYYDIKTKTKADVMLNNPDKSPQHCTPPKTKTKNPFPTMCYKTLRYPPKQWNPQISRSAMLKSDGKEEQKNLKPAKFFKMRNNMPRYLGNPASGVKPMYQLHASSDKSEKDSKLETSDPKKQSILKIDPKTLKPISDRAPEALTTQSDLKINTSSVSIFSPLKLHSSKNEVKSPKSPAGLMTASPPAKRDKLNVSCTPSNPFIPNLSPQTMNPNQFLYPSGPPGFPSYDPRIMVAYHSLIYGQQLPFHSPLLANITSENALKKYDIPQPSNSKNNYRAPPPPNESLKNQVDAKQKPTKSDKSLQSALEKINQNKKKEGLKQDETFKINNLVRESKPEVCKENETGDTNKETKVNEVIKPIEDVVQENNNVKDDVNIAPTKIEAVCDNNGNKDVEENLSNNKAEKSSILENSTTDNALSESDTKKF